MKTLEQDPKTITPVGASWIEASQPPEARSLELATKPAASAVAATAAGKLIDEALRTRVAKVRDESSGDWSNVRIGRAIGYTDAVVSQYLKGTYHGDVQEVEKRLRAWLRNLTLALDVEVPSQPTEVSRRFATWLEDIRTSRGAGVIIAPPGLGKSRAVELYCAGNELAIRLAAWEGECSRAAVEAMLFSAADVVKGARARRAATLVPVMQGSGRPIVIDDAHYLTMAALRMLFGFRERTGMPLALVGTERILDKLESDPQLLRRVTYKRELAFERLKAPMELVEQHVRVILGEGLSAEDRREVLRLGAIMARRAGHFGSVQLCLARAVRIKRAKPDKDWRSAIMEAHAHLVRDYALDAAAAGSN
jgi:DNA transposition AAA+ family ATPase